MPRGAEELTNARKENIIQACASLYMSIYEMIYTGTKRLLAGGQL